MKKTENPLISFCLFAYNQEQFIREAIEGALSQTYSPLEIILSDDCSSDRTFSIMEEMVADYKGLHKIILNKNSVNLGLCSHFNRIMELASGDLIVCAAGDDISLPDRTKIAWDILQRNPETTCVSLQSDIIDTDGNLLSEYSQARSKPYCRKFTIKDYLSVPGFHLNGATRVFRKVVHTTFGSLGPCGTEDSPTLLRCLMLGDACECSEVGIRYRIHGGNLSAGGNLNRFVYEPVFEQWLKDIELAVEKRMVSSILAAKLRRQAKKRLARRHLEAAFSLSDHKIRLLVSQILLSRTFTIREKARMVRAEFREYRVKGSIKG